jgi:hypothetical protein
MLKMALLAPIPSAKVNMTSVANPGLRRTILNPKRMSFSKFPIFRPLFNRKGRLPREFRKSPEMAQEWLLSVTGKASRLPLGVLL